MNIMAPKISYPQFINSDFYSFFNLEEIDRKGGEHGVISYYYKPGGFQEYIDLNFIMKNNDILQGILKIDRIWLGDINHLNMFAKDITKSFLELLIPNDLKEFKLLLIQNIWNMKGNEDRVICWDEVVKCWEDYSPEVKTFLDVYRGISNFSQKVFEDATILMENQPNKEENKIYFITSVYWNEIDPNL